MLRSTRFGDILRFDLARTLLGRGRYWTAAYYVDGLLVDTGCAHTARELVPALGGLPVSQIVNTHSHEDHIGANGLLQRAGPELIIRAHPLALPVLADPKSTPPLQPYRLVFWGWPDPSRAAPLEDGAIVETERYRFRVVYTPGHSPDHLCLYEPNAGWLFTGDLFVGGQERALRDGYDILGILASLKRIATLPAEWLFPASARARDHAAEALAAKIAYLEELGGRINDLHRDGCSVPEIARIACGGRMPVEWITLGHLTREHLVRSYLKGSD